MCLHLLSNSFINIPKSLLTKILLNFHESNRVHLRAVSLIHAVSQEGWRFGSNCLWILQGERCNLLLLAGSSHYTNRTVLQLLHFLLFALIKAA